MGIKEKVLLDELVMAASAQGNRLFRNNSGKYQDREGNWIAYGVGQPGGSDLIGFTKIVVTPDMVGKQIAVFTAIEAKTGKLKPTDDQRKFIEMVNARGGIGLWGTDVVELMYDVASWTPRLRW